MVVCTLCSCYPKMLLGIPPAWYKSLAYRSRVVVDPRGVLSEAVLREIAASPTPDRAAEVVHPRALGRRAVGRVAHCRMYVEK